MLLVKNNIEKYYHGGIVEEHNEVLFCVLIDKLWIMSDSNIDNSIIAHHNIFVTKIFRNFLNFSHVIQYLHNMCFSGQVSELIGIAFTDFLDKNKWNISQNQYEGIRI